MILHAGASTFGAALLAAVALAAAGSAVLLGLGLAALRRRRSRSYLLVALALSALFGRAAVAALAMAGTLDAGSHHLLEHGLDAGMAALVIAAVYHARTVEREAEGRVDPAPDDSRGADPGAADSRAADAGGDRP